MTDYRCQMLGHDTTGVSINGHLVTVCRRCSRPVSRGDGR